jgi:hypothetical protein
MPSAVSQVLTVVCVSQATKYAVQILKNSWLEWSIFKEWVNTDCVYIAYSHDMWCFVSTFVVLFI